MAGRLIRLRLTADRTPVLSERRTGQDQAQNQECSFHGIPYRPSRAFLSMKSEWAGSNRHKPCCFRGAGLRTSSSFRSKLPSKRWGWRSCRLSGFCGARGNCLHNCGVLSEIDHVPASRDHNARQRCRKVVSLIFHSQPAEPAGAMLTYRWSSYHVRQAAASSGKCWAVMSRRAW
jgi:hypothetical protein